MKSNQGCRFVNTLLEIYDYHLRKDQLKVNHLLSHLNLPFKPVALFYTRVFADGQAIYFPIIWHENAFCWAKKGGGIATYQTVLNRPEQVSINDLNLLSNLESGDDLEIKSHPLNIMTEDRFELFPIQYHYHLNQSVSNLACFIEKENYYHYADIWRVFQREIISKVEYYLFHENYSKLNHYLTKPKPSKVAQIKAEIIHLKYACFSRSENTCFIAIYFGCLEYKDIAKLVCKSVRTVQNLIQSMVKKLNLKNRYELFIEIKNASSHAQYLLNQSEYYFLTNDKLTRRSNNYSKVNVDFGLVVN